MSNPPNNCWTRIDLPGGYSLLWSGTTSRSKIKASLAVAIPLVLLLIVLILIIHLCSIAKTLLDFCASFSVVESHLDGLFLAMIYPWRCGGIIALLGWTRKPVLVMLHYQDEARSAKAAGRLRSEDDLRVVCMKCGATHPPKIMTVHHHRRPAINVRNCVGADTMQRLAAPMIGGLISSTIMELILLPAAYLIQRRLNRKGFWLSDLRWRRYGRCFALEQLIYVRSLV